MNARFRRLAVTFCLLSFLTTLSSPAWGWGKRGHATVCETAAYLLQGTGLADFMNDRSYDLGYYCNVPDLIWKRPNHYQEEWFNHFMDLEIYSRSLKKDEMPKALLSGSRVDFAAAHPDIPDNAGRSFWRIDELMKRADKITEGLKASELSRDERHRLQADWLVTSGALGHYVGDLAQPLHTSENYDGQMTQQNGIHAWFEDDVVNQLYVDAGPALAGDVMKAAKTKWNKLGASWGEKPVRELLLTITEESNKKMIELLKIDKKLGRKDLAAAAKAYRSLVVERLAAGSVALAALWRRELGWKFDNVKFYTWIAEPEYISYEKPQPTPTPAPKN